MIVNTEWDTTPATKEDIRRVLQHARDQVMANTGWEPIDPWTARYLQRAIDAYERAEKSKANATNESKE